RPQPSQEASQRSECALGASKKSPRAVGGRGRRHPPQLRLTLLSLITEAIDAGARQREACRIVGITERTLQRWRREHGGQDARRGPNSPVEHRLSEVEKDAAMALANRHEY